MLRVERLYYADGSLREETHYLGTLEHGPWRTWHPNGVLATEHWFDHGRYFNCVNRTWDASGRLLGECVWVAGILTESRIYDASGALVDEALISKQAEAAERVARKRKLVRRDRIAPDAALVQSIDTLTHLLRSGTRDAMSWLEEGTEPHSRSIGMLTQNQSIELVRHLRSLGATGVLVAAVERTPGTSVESTNHVLLELPPRGRERKALFEFERTHAAANGYTPEVDTGGQYLYLKFA